MKFRRLHLDHSFTVAVSRAVVITLILKFFPFFLRFLSSFSSCFMFLSFVSTSSSLFGVVALERRVAGGCFRRRRG